MRIERSDAFRALMRAEQSFDVIVSEPSNPWVSGVEMLYSREFLEVARSRLSPGGVYGQWLHTYETDRATLELILRTYASVFDHVSVWYLMSQDLLLLGFNDRAFATLIAQWRSDDPESAALERVLKHISSSVIASETVETLMGFYSDDKSADDSPITIDRAQKASEEYANHYHHAAPFDGERLLETWGRCRVNPPSAEQCADHLKNVRRGSPLKGEAELAEMLEECRSTLKVGPACQRGVDEARTLLSVGEAGLEGR